MEKDEDEEEESRWVWIRIGMDGHRYGFTGLERKGLPPLLLPVCALLYFLINDFTIGPTLTSLRSHGADVSLSFGSACM